MNYDYKVTLKSKDKQSAGYLRKLIEQAVGAALADAEVSGKLRVSRIYKAREV